MCNDHIWVALLVATIVQCYPEGAAHAAHYFNVFIRFKEMFNECCFCSVLVDNIYIMSIYIMSHYIWAGL